MKLRYLCGIILSLAALGGCQNSNAKPVLHTVLQSPIPLPIAADGRVDYVTLLNQRCSNGVTRENNAAVILLAVLPGTRAGKDAGAKKALGVLPNPFAWTEFDAYVAATHLPPANTLYDDLDAAGGRRWSYINYPLASQWLVVQGNALNQISGAVQRPRYFVPMISEHVPPTLLDCFMSEGLGEYRIAAESFAARATLRLNDGDVDGFISDLHACHRLADLMAQHPFLIDQLVAVSIHAIPSKTITGLLARGELNGEALRKARALMDENPAINLSPECVDVFERAFTEDLVQLSRLGQLADPRKIMANDLINTDAPIGDLGQTDWNIVEKIASANLDRVASGIAGMDHARFRQIEKQMVAETAAWKLPEYDFWLMSYSLGDDPAKRNEAAEFLMRRADESRSSYSTRIARYLFLDDNSMMLRSRLVAENQRMSTETIRVGLAAAAFHEATGRFPAALSDLVPAYVPNVPIDWFSGKPLAYKHDGADIVIYSVGNNEKDDGGTLSMRLDAGDIGVRVKAAALP